MTALPSTMLAIEISSPGGPEVLRPVRRPLPVPGAGEVLIQVAAAGVNRPDVLQRGPLSAAARRLRPPGLEVAGTVVAIGAGRRRAGASATRCARSSPAAATPSTASPRRRSACRSRAASMSSRPRRCPRRSSPCGPTSSSAGGSQPGETLLVHGGASGIGTTAIQMAQRARRARSSPRPARPRSAPRARRSAPNARSTTGREDFVAGVREAPAGRGVDVILDMVGGDYLPRNLALLRAEGGSSRSRSCRAARPSSTSPP